MAESRPASAPSDRSATNVLLLQGLADLSACVDERAQIVDSVLEAAVDLRAKPHVTAHLLTLARRLVGEVSEDVTLFAERVRTSEPSESATGDLSVPAGGG